MTYLCMCVQVIIWPPIEQNIIKYQNPANVDQIMKIQRNLDEVNKCAIADMLYAMYPYSDSLCSVMVVDRMTSRCLSCTL